MFRNPSIPVFILLIVSSQVMIGSSKEDGSKCIEQSGFLGDCIKCPSRHYIS